MKKLLLIGLGFILLIVGCDSCTNDKVDTDDKSKSDKMFKLIKGVAKDKLGKSKVDCSKRCEDGFDFLGWSRETKGEGIDSLFNQCVKECIGSSGDSLKTQ